MHYNISSFNNKILVDILNVSQLQSLIFLNVKWWCKNENSRITFFQHKIDYLLMETIQCQ